MEWLQIFVFYIQSRKQWEGLGATIFSGIWRLVQILTIFVKNVDNGTWSVETISVQLDLPGVG